ncbi:MAG: hypothetical protein RLP02_04650, partial [Coleofasciculus sp. C2-GNP5-27]
MGWSDRTLINGKSWTEYRLEIEGFDYGFVTNRGMEKTESGVTYVRGLKSEDLSYSHQVSIREARLTSTSMRFSIVDYKNQATEAFIRSPGKEARLRANVSHAEAIIPVSNTTGWQAGDIAFIGTEAALVASVDTSLHRLITSRGYLNSTSQSHNITTDFGGAMSPGVYDAPVTLQNRRVNLYAYGRGDDLQGNGTAIWKGVLWSDVELTDASTYELTAYPITEIFKTELGGRWGEYPVRGIYIPDEYAFVADIAEASGSINVASNGLNYDTLSIDLTASGFAAQ